MPDFVKRSILTWWRTGSAFDSRPQGCGFDSLSRQTFCFLYLCAQAFSASLKRSLNLSANKHYYYYYYEENVRKGKVVPMIGLNQDVPVRASEVCLCVFIILVKGF